MYLFWAVYSWRTWLFSPEKGDLPLIEWCSTVVLFSLCLWHTWVFSPKLCLVLLPPLPVPLPSFLVLLPPLPGPLPPFLILRRSRPGPSVRSSMRVSWHL